ncbi:MAG: phosphatidylglycerol lysyltransferase domain-containing protein [Gemmatimonadaceae bacterium]
MTDADWHAARELVMRHGWNAVAYQILNPGMRHWFSRARDAVAGYAPFAGTWVVAGAPVCAPERLATAAAELEAEAAACGTRVLYFGAGERLERVYAERTDHSLVRLGAQPVWDPEAWPDIVRRKASLRAQLNRARNKGVHITELPAARARTSDTLRAVLREWLATRGLPPLSFLVVPDILDNLDDRRTFVAERDGRVVGFLIGTPVPARQGWLVEEWPRTRDAPNGTTHSLVDAAMRAFAAGGSRYVTLGLAPLAEHGGGTVAGQPTWLRAVLRWVRAHGRRFYNFAGLEAFKASMQPMAWEPIYAIAPGGRFTPRLLRAVAGAFSAGDPERLIARALRSAAREEVRRWRARSLRS